MRVWLTRALIVAAAVALVAWAGHDARRTLLRTLAVEHYFRSGWRALNRRDIERAEALFRRAQERTTRPGEMAARIGLAYADPGPKGTAPRWPRRATRWLARAIEIRPDQPAAVYWELGGAHWAMGDLQAATAPLERAVALHPDNPLTLNALGYLLAERRIELDRAVALLRRALDKLPANAPREVRWSIDDSLGWAYYQRGEYRQALPLLQGAHEGLNARKINDPEVAYHLGMIYLVLHRRSEGTAVLRRAANAGSRPARAALKRLRVGAK